MFGYSNNNYFSTVPYSDEIIDVFLELYNKIKEKFQSINKNEEILLVDDSLCSVDLMMDSFYKLVDVLGSNPLFEDEYLLSLSILSSIEFIIDSDILKENIDYVGNVVVNFCKLISTKQDWILLNKNFNYDKEFDDFYSFYINQQDQFLIKLPRNDEYDEAIDRVINMLW